MIDEIRNFYEKSKFDFCTSIEKTEDFKWPLNWIKIFFKTYPRLPKIKLRRLEIKDEIHSILYNRKSRREYFNAPISFAQLNEIIFYSVGIRNSSEPLSRTKRFYPSAGARYPIELYFISNNVQGLAKGLYHYSVKQNELEVLLKKDLRSKSSRIFGDGNWHNSNFIILTSVIGRTEVKYGINAYRFSLLEAGHIGQNISLLTEKQGLGSCALGGFDNDVLKNLLDLTEEEIPLYAFSIGKPTALTNS